MERTSFCIREGQQVLLKHGGHYIRVHPCPLTRVNPQKKVQQNNAEDRKSLKRKLSLVNNAKKSIMRYNSEDEIAHVNESSSYIQSNKESSTPLHIANLLPIESIQQNTENSPRIHIATFKSSTSETDKSPPVFDNSIPQ